MGLGSFFKKLGKGALKIAPFAAMAIPGVGVPLGMAIQGGLGAANAKVSGGGWKEALLGAGVGAGTAGLGGSGALGKLAGKGIGGKLAKGAIESTIKNVGQSLGGPGIGPSDQFQYRTPDFMPQGQGMEDLGGMIGNALGEGLPRRRQPIPSGEQGYRGGMGRAINRSRDMRLPNLTNPIEQGANEALLGMGRLPRIPTAY